MEASGPPGCDGNHCALMLTTAVSRERAQGNCWNDRMVWAAFLPQVPVLARVRSTRAKPPVPILDLGGFALWYVRGPNFGLGYQLRMCGYLKK